MRPDLSVRQLYPILERTKRYSLLTGIFMFTLSETKTNRLVLLVPLLFVLGAATNTCSIVGVVYGSRLFPDQAGTVSGLLMGCVWVVSGLSAYIFSWLADPLEGGTPDFAVACISVSVLIGFTFYLFLPHEKSLCSAVKTGVG